MQTDQAGKEIKVIWESGTAYDFLASLDVMHFPVKWGLRGAWAAGVRSRIPQEERDFLEVVVELLLTPYYWIYTLPDPKDTETLLYALKQIPPAERLTKLILSPPYCPEPVVELRKELSTKKWSEVDPGFVTAKFREWYQGIGIPVPKKRVEQLLSGCENAEEFGRRYLSALQAYYEAFFAEEEKRIAPKLDRALAQAQEMAEEMSLPELLEELSRGQQFDKFPKVTELILAPSFWFTPIMVSAMISEESKMFLFGARSTGESLDPGEIVPDALIQMLKALADPTRLRILRYLVQEQLTPAELSRRLRLRAPTVTHHLHALRLAGLVRFVKRGKHEHLYSTTIDSVQGKLGLLNDFLEESAQEGLLSVLEKEQAAG